MHAHTHALVWFRNDLRVRDNPALFHAHRQHERVSAVFFLTPEQWHRHDLSTRRIAFLIEALQSLASNLASCRIDLIIEEVPLFADVGSRLERLCDRLQISQLYFNQEYALDETIRDRAVVELMQQRGIGVNRFHGSVVVPPGAVLTQQGQAFKIFTPFKRAWMHSYLRDHGGAPLAGPKVIDKNATASKSSFVKRFTARYAPVAGFPASEKEAEKRLRRFGRDGLDNYAHSRDFPADAGTSTLSPYLCLGLISPRQCLHFARSYNQGELTSGNQGATVWINELVWREFYLHLMWAFPDICKHKALRPETEHVPWRHDKDDFSRWCKGKTGFPLVDAAMVQLNTTGWMHNRLRMLSATFLCKHLLIDWRWGERYFMQQLVDGHFASNNGGWQWSASTGTDAAPYFRILSPVRQAQRFDPEARFIKSMLPALSDLSPKSIMKPGHPDLLAKGYPAPMVDLAEAKARCLSAFQFATKGE